MQHISKLSITSKTHLGVSFTIRRMTFGRRLEMMRAVRELTKQLEFHSAGSTIADQTERGILTSEINTVYMNWGLVEINGLDIDGTPATPDSLLNEGPEQLCFEILEAIKSECFLTEEERKN